MNLEDNKKTFKRYGDIIEYADLKSDHFPQKIKQGRRLHPGHFVKESEFDLFVTTVIDVCSVIEAPYYHATKLPFAEIDFIEKRKDHLKVNVCMEEQHYLSYDIPKNDILFFAKIKNKQPAPYIIVKDDAIDRILQAEHTIFGIIDFAQGESLLYQDSNDTRLKMEKFHKEIERIGEKYKKILLITISDSILLKHSFKMVSDKNLRLEISDFKIFIKAFNDIKAIIEEIFHMNCYGIFSYGANLSKALPPTSNVLHTGILSNEFKHIIDLDSKVKKIRKDKQGDIYLTKTLFRTYRHTVVKEYEKNGEIKELFNTESIINPEDIIDAKDIIDLKDIIAVRLAGPPFKVSKSER